MLGIGNQALIEIGNGEAGQNFAAGRVVAASRKTFAVEFNRRIAMEAGQELDVFTTAHGKFFRQGVRVMQLQAEDSKFTATLARVGRPELAERRRSFRISVGGADLFVQIDPQEHCRVLDLGPQGFSAIVPRQLKIGGVAFAQFTHGPYVFSTLARVMTATPLPDGTFRMGFRTLEPPEAVHPSPGRTSQSGREDRLYRLFGA